MTIQHSNITDPNIHEPKGISSEVSGKVYVSDGSGSGSWRFIPNGYLYYDNIGTGFTISSPTSMTLINAPSSGGSLLREFSHNSLGRLTYTGSDIVGGNIISSITFKHSTASGADCYFQIFKNGSALTGARTVVSADSTNFHSAEISGFDGSISSNDFFEVYCQVSSGNIIIHAITLTADGVI